MKRVGVVVRSANPQTGRGAEALRAAVGLAAGGLCVRVFLVEDGVAALDTGQAFQKALMTLGLLGHEVLVERESLRARGRGEPPSATARLFDRAELPRLLVDCDALEGWR
jgi:sulfur relay (sulfurtransferase) DsrF/TusC family protein